MVDKRCVDFIKWVDENQPMKDNKVSSIIHLYGKDVEFLRTYGRTIILSGLRRRYYTNKDTCSSCDYLSLIVYFSKGRKELKR